MTMGRLRKSEDRKGKVSVNEEAINEKATKSGDAGAGDEQISSI
jgi:hypothetical protein